MVTPKVQAMATEPNAHEHGRACSYERGAGFGVRGPWIAICAGM